jgi:hypothetical protein
MPDTGEDPAERFDRALPLHGTPGEDYVQRRGIPVPLAHDAGMRFDVDWAGRPAVLFALCDREGRLLSVHGRYLHTVRSQDKMLTVGLAGGVAMVGEGCSAEPLLIVEGVFDALSLAVCGASAIATVGRWAPWLPEVCAGRTVWLGFDANQPGEQAAASYALRLDRALTRRLLPPPGCKDWSTALVKRGPRTLSRWLRDALAAGDTTAR